MAASFIQMPIDGAGKKVQTWVNTIGPDNVNTEAVTLTDSAGTEKGTSGNPLRTDPTGTTVQPVDGALTNNNAAPAATELGVMPALANAAAPSWSEGNQVLLSVDLAGNQRVKIAAGSAVIGHVITDSGSTTAVTGTVTVAGGKTNNNAAPGATNVGSLGFLANAAAPSWTEGNLVAGSVDLAGNQRVILTAGSAVIGHVITDSGSVTTATLSAETSKVIGTVRILGNTGATLDAAGQNASSPANSVLIAGQFNTSPTTISSGNMSPLQVDNAGSLLVHITAGAGSGGTAIADEAAFTEGSTQFTPIGGEFKNAGASLTSGQAGIVRMTADRNMMVDVEKFGATAISTGTGTGGAGIPRVTVSNDSNILATQSGSWTVTANAGTNLNTSALALDTSVNGLLVSQGSSTSGQKGSLIQTATTANAPTYTSGQTNPVSTDTNGNVRVVSSPTLPAIVQKTSNTSSGSVASLVKAFGSNNIAGNSIIVVVGVGNGPNPPVITDSAGNTYYQACYSANGTAFAVAVFFATAIVAGANTVTATNGGANASMALEIYEVSGLLTINGNQSQPDSSNVTVGSTSPATLAIEPLQSNDYIFGGIGLGTAAQTITVGSPLTNDSGQLNPTTPAGLFSMVSFSRFAGEISAGNLSATFTNEPYSMVAAAFRVVSQPIGGSVNVLGIFNSNPPSLVSGQASVLQLDSSANLKVVLATSSAVIGHVITDSGSTTVVTGNIGAKTNNNAAPGATNVGALGFLANASAPSWSEGNLVLGSVDLAGNQRVILVASSAVIGHVITDAGSVTTATLSAETTKVIGTVRNLGNVGAIFDGVITAATAPANMIMTGGVFNSSLPTLTNGQSAAIQVDAKGQQYVDLNFVLGAIHSATNPIFNELTDGTNTIGAMTNFGTTPGAVKAVGVNASLFQGTVAVGTGAPLQVTLANTAANAVPVSVNQVPQTTGGYTTASGQSLSNSAVAIKASAGQVFGWFLDNTANAVVTYFQFFNTAAGGVTVGTTVPLFSVAIPANSAANVFNNSGIAFGTAISIAATTGYKNGSAPGSTVTYNVWYA